MRTRFVRPLLAEAQATLWHTYHTSDDAALVRRCQAIRLSAQGKTIAAIADLLQVHRSTIQRWLSRYETADLAGLANQWGDGRPPGWDEAYEHLLVQTLRHDPRWSGLEQSNWTCPLLAGYLAEKTGVRLSAERVRVLLHQHGLRLKQPTAVPPHRRDPRYDPKG
jgi:transposase